MPNVYTLQELAEYAMGNTNDNIPEAIGLKLPGDFRVYIDPKHYNWSEVLRETVINVLTNHPEARRYPIKRNDAAKTPIVDIKPIENTGSKKGYSQVKVVVEGTILYINLCYNKIDFVRVLEDVFQHAGLDTSTLTVALKEPLPVKI